jgi:SAM-dependent methyltransferase
VLDLPRGIGRHSVELARRGLRVTAVDRTQVYLEQPRGAARVAGLPIEFAQADMRTFQPEQAFDAAFNLWTSFGSSDDPGDDLQTMRNFFACLRPGGRLVMELSGKEALAKQFTPRTWRELPDGTLLAQHHMVEQDWTWVVSRWVIVQGGQRQGSHSACDLTQRPNSSGRRLRRVSWTCGAWPGSVGSPTTRRPRG